VIETGNGGWRGGNMPGEVRFLPAVFACAGLTSASPCLVWHGFPVAPSVNSGKWKVENGLWILLLLSGAY
jgi:hypothetical protein